MTCHRDVLYDMSLRRPWRTSPTRSTLSTWRQLNCRVEAGVDNFPGRTLASDAIKWTGLVELQKREVPMSAHPPSRRILNPDNGFSMPVADDVVDAEVARPTWNTFNAS